MRIETSSVSLCGSHSAATTHLVRESQRVSVVPEARTPVAGQDTLSVSDQAKVSWPPAEKPDPSKMGLDLDSGLDPEMRMLKALVERLFGVKIETISPKVAEGGEAKRKQDAPSATRPQVSPGISVAYDRQETQIDSESTTVVARGVVKTSDGKSIDFDLSLTMSRMVVSQYQVSVRAGAVAQDPLVINFAGEAAQLTDARFSFDLNADGSAEKTAIVGAIHLEPVVSQFDLKGSDQVSSGQVRSTGTYLSESGEAGSVQQVDLVV